MLLCGRPVAPIAIQGIRAGSGGDISVTETSSSLPRIDAGISADAARDYSPPPLQSLLCTFLI